MRTRSGGRTLGRITIVFTDVEDSVRATAALGDLVFRDKMLDPLHKRTIETLGPCGGQLQREIGDSHLITFPHADDALRCVVELQKGLARIPIECKDPSGTTWTLRVRIGVHASEAEVSLDELGQLVGRDVNLAARILSLGRGGQIIASQETHRAAGGRENYRWTQWPGRRIKSFNDPETVWELLWDDGPSRGEPGSRWFPDWFAREINEFVGREVVLAEIRERLARPQHPLQVLVGPPGVGKTRLAVQTVLDTCAAYEAGVAFVALADGDPRDRPRPTAASLAAALALAVKAPADVAAQAEHRLIEYLNEHRPEKERLVVLDGWEAVHSRETLDWLGRAVRGCRRVRWLVTSAVVLNLVDIGQRMLIPPMGVPEDDATPLADVESFRLFCARLSLCEEPPALDDEESIRTILRLAEGHPLSIELAAAWAEYRSLYGLAALMREDLLAVLRTPPGALKSGPARHESIEASLAWLCQLFLPPDERAALHRLAHLPEVFSPGQAEADQGIQGEWLWHWKQIGLVEGVGRERTTQFRLRRVVREYCRRLDTGHSGPSSPALRVLDDPLSTLADLISLWRGRDRNAWARSSETYPRLADRFLRFGETLMAHEVIDEGLSVQPSCPRLRQLLGLALIRSGSIGRAREVLSTLAAQGHDDAETLGLLARTSKGLGLVAGSPAERLGHFREAYDLYLRVFDRHREAWTGINAATLGRIVGLHAASHELARDVRTLCQHQLVELEESESDLYWTLAMLGEAELVLGDVEEAVRHYRRAVREARGRFGDVKSTRDNARLLLSLDEYAAWRLAVEEALSIPDVVVFVGHMIDRPGRQPPRFPPVLERPVAREIRRRLQEMNALIGYSSAACGSDLLFQEALRELEDLGAEAHVALPYEREAFVRDSVDIVAGSDGKARFDRCLKRADVVICSDRRLELEGISYQFANLYLQGLAAARAAQLETGLRYLAVWDGRRGDGPWGTADTIARWRAQGHEVEVIRLDTILRNTFPELAPPASREEDRDPIRFEGPGAGPGMRIMAVLFARIAGFDELVESQLPAFIEHFLGLIARRLDAAGLEPLKRNSWGDGIFLAFDHVRDAGRIALDLCHHATGAACAGSGLPGDLALRVGLHAGPAFYGQDPVTGRLNTIGDHVGRAAAIGAAARPGRACASREFAALVAAEGVRDFGFYYLGQTSMSGGRTPTPIYEVRPAGDAEVART